MTINRTSPTNQTARIPRPSLPLSTVALAASLVVLAACGSSTTATPGAAEALAPAVTVAPATTAPSPTTMPTPTIPTTTIPTPTIPTPTIPTTTIPTTTIPTPTIPTTTIPTTTIPTTTIPTPTIPTPIPTPSLAPLPAPVSTCGEVGAEPPFAAIVSEQFVDVVGDGSADDRVLSHVEGGWTLRATVGGVTSELTIDDVGPGAVRVLGVADVGELTAGNEILATTGAGAYSTQIGIFGIDSSGCLFHFADQFGEDLAMPVGASVGFGDRFFCGTHLIGANSWSLYEDGTYDVAGAAYFESSPGMFTYLPASDDYSEGVPADELPSPLFDCFGLTL